MVAAHLLNAGPKVTAAQIGAGTRPDAHAAGAVRKPSEVIPTDRSGNPTPGVIPLSVSADRSGGRFRLHGSITSGHMAGFDANLAELVVDHSRDRQTVDTRRVSTGDVQAATGGTGPQVGRVGLELDPFTYTGAVPVPEVTRAPQRANRARAGSTSDDPGRAQRWVRPLYDRPFDKVARYGGHPSGITHVEVADRGASTPLNFRTRVPNSTPAAGGSGPTRPVGVYAGAVRNTLRNLPGRWDESRVVDGGSAGDLAVDPGTAALPRRGRFGL